MGLDQFRTEDNSDAQDESEEQPLESDAVDESYLNESKPHTSSKERIKQELSEDGYEVSLEKTIRVSEDESFRVDVHARCVDSTNERFKNISEGDEVIFSVGEVSAHKLRILSIEFDYVGIVPSGRGLPSRVVADTSHNTQEKIDSEDINTVTSSSRSERKRGPYIDKDAYEKLDNASDEYDLTIQDTLDKLLDATLNDEGEIKQQHSVLRNEMREA